MHYRASERLTQCYQICVITDKDLLAGLSNSMIGASIICKPRVESPIRERTAGITIPERISDNKRANTQEDWMWRHKLSTFAKGLATYPGDINFDWGVSTSAFG